jgi:hypothetical protein
MAMMIKPGSTDAHARVCVAMLISTLGFLQIPSTASSIASSPLPTVRLSDHALLQITSQRQGQGDNVKLLDEKSSAGVNKSWGKEAIQEEDLVEERTKQFPSTDSRYVTQPTVPPAPTRHGLAIGVGFDARRADFWSFRGNYPLDFFSDDIPTSCFLEEPCSTAVVKKSRNFNTRNRWQQAYVQTFGIDIQGGGLGGTAGFGMEIGQNFNNGWSRNGEILWSSITKTQKCYQLRSSCLTNPVFMSGSARALLDQLPLNSTAADAMRIWAVSFVQNFGTHVAVKSSHGAMLQATSSTNSHCKWSSSCRTLAARARVGFLNHVDLEATFNSSGCTSSLPCEESTEVECTAVGGDPATSRGLCGAQVGEDQIIDFLASGDVQSASTTIGLKLRPMYEVVGQMGFWDQALQIEKATQFYSCKSPFGEWLQHKDGDPFSCQCTLQCKNGGRLNREDCSCDCPGDDVHGFTGEDCSETYGKCVRGSGSSDTPTAFRRACQEDNMCGGIEVSEYCRNTEVCCNRDEGGTCCPLGSTCDCSPRRGRFCECRNSTENLF